jgi:hypothetical protein
LAILEDVAKEYPTSSVPNESIKEQEKYKELAKREKSNGIYYSEYLKLKQKENDTSRI